MRIVTRSEWEARGPFPNRRMRLPAKTVVLHHSVTEPTSDPAADMRVIERVGISRFGRISYSYAIAPEGTILEGCADRVGAHTAGQNSTTFGIVLIGNYEARSVKVQQIDAVRWLIADLIVRRWLRPGTYPTGGHRDVPGAATACPGAKAYRLLDAMRVPWETPRPVPVPTMEVAPMYSPPIGPIAAVWQDDDGRVLAAVSPEGDVYAWAVPWVGNVRGKPYWVDREAALIGPPEHPGGMYTVTSTDGGTYTLPDGLDGL